MPRKGLCGPWCNGLAPLTVTQTERVRFPSVQLRDWIYMSSFTFDAHGVSVTAFVEEGKGTIIGRKTYKAHASCPICHKELTAGTGMGDRYKQNEVKTTLKTNMKKHIKTIHKK